MKPILFLTGILVIGFAAAADARAQRLEVELGGGYVFGGGVENPGPTLPVFDAGVVVWPAARWGVALRLVDGPGEDLHEPIVSSDRTFLGQGHLHYWTLTARHRSVLTPTLGMEFGSGCSSAAGMRPSRCFTIRLGGARRQTRSSAALPSRRFSRDPW